MQSGKPGPRGPGFSISEPPESDKTSLGLLTIAELELQALGGVQPWASVKRAQQGANHDYVFNHTEGSDTYRGMKADLMQGTGPLDFDGAVNLYQFMDYAVRHGGTVDFNYHATETVATINKIITETGVPSDLVWSFFHNLDRVARESGNPTIMNPNLTKMQSAKPDEAFGDLPWGWWIGGGLVALGLIAYIVHKE